MHYTRIDHIQMVFNSKLKIDTIMQGELGTPFASAIRYLLDNLEEAKRMGENGRRAVEQEFNWGVEEKKLLKLYEELENNE